MGGCITCGIRVRSDSGGGLKPPWALGKRPSLGLGVICGVVGEIGVARVGRAAPHPTYGDGLREGHGGVV
jgi:hypothetical protein